MKQLCLHPCEDIMFFFYIYLPRSHINILFPILFYETYSVFRVVHCVQMSGHETS
jgi:hypothetical protein